MIFDILLLIKNHSNKIPFIFEKYRDQIIHWNLVLKNAINNDQYEIIKLLTSNGIGLDENHTFVNKQMLRYLLENRYEITEQVSKHSSEDYYEVVRYLHELHHPIAKSHVIENIAKQTLYMLENKIPKTIVIQKCLEGLKWAVNSGYSFPEDNTQIFIHLSFSVKLIEWLLTVTKPPINLRQIILESAHIETVRWILNQNPETSAYEQECLRYLSPEDFESIIQYILPNNESYYPWIFKSGIW